MNEQFATLDPAREGQPVCARSCEHHTNGDQQLSCIRVLGHDCQHGDNPEAEARCPKRAGHGTARLAADMHLADYDDQPIFFDERCCQ